MIANFVMPCMKCRRGRGRVVSMQGDMKGVGEIESKGKIRDRKIRREGEAKG